MSVAFHLNAFAPPLNAETLPCARPSVGDFLKAYLRFGKQEIFTFFVENPHNKQDILHLSESLNIDATRLALWDAKDAAQKLRSFNVVFRAAPDPQNLLWTRKQAAELSFAFCGLAPFPSNPNVHEILEHYCFGPSDISDALVCPSKAVKDIILSYWAIYADYIERRFGAHFKCPVQLAVIPHGVDIERALARSTPDKRLAQRERLGLAEDDFVVLGHSFDSNPLTMFRAVEAAARRTSARVHFLLIERTNIDAHRRLAADFCEAARVSFFTARDPRFPDGLCACADAFLSLLDSPHEDTGPLSIEAIAAGLPRVLSDWGVFRDSVRQGEDGFLVRTVQPPPGAGYSFQGQPEFFVAIDAGVAAEALVALIDNPDLRRRMAEKAKERLPSYDLRAIVAAYENLWSACAEKRAMLHEDFHPLFPPQTPDPFAFLSAATTAVLRPTDRICLMTTTDEISLLWRHEVNVTALDYVVSPDDIMALLNWIATQSRPTLGEAFAMFTAFDPARLWRTFGWLAKLGIIQIM